MGRLAQLRAAWPESVTQDEMLEAEPDVNNEVLCFHLWRTN